MDTKIKKLLSRRQSRSAIAIDNGLLNQSAPYEATSPSPRQPIVLYQPLSKSTTDLRRDAQPNDTCQLKTFAYDSVIAGKAPIFLSALPQKGNGPVKLQATRVSGNGEVVTTVDDPSETLQEIREGDYVVARQDRPISQIQKRRPSDLSPASPSTTPRMGEPTTSPHRTAFHMSSPTSEKDHAISRQPSRGTPSTSGTNIGLGLSPPSFRKSRGSSESWSDQQSSARPSTSQGTTPPNSSASHEINATLKALRKAEYSRLVDMYGADIAARNLARMDREHLAISTTQLPKGHSRLSSVILEPLPAPNESRESVSNRGSGISATSESCCDEWSGTSSPYRGSFVSSCADSSNATGQTSVTEDDTATTREDIRKMVEQMRSNYLEALDTRPANTSRPKPRRKKQRRTQLMPSPAIDAVANSAPNHTGRRTWHPENSDFDVHSQRRIHSQPVNGFSRLSPIEASPTREEGQETGLKRADSTTLGQLMANITRSKAKSQSRIESSARASNSRPQTPRIHTRPDTRSWLNLESDSAEDLHVESPQEMEVPHDNPRIFSRGSTAGGQLEPGTTLEAEDLGTLYHDSCSKNADAVWTSISAGSSNHAVPILDTNSQARHLNTFNSPTPKIPSIPESPEYTRLARTDSIESNFI